MFILLFPDVALPPFQTILGHASDGRAPVSDAAGSHSFRKARTVHVCLLTLHSCKPEVHLILGKTVARATVSPHLYTQERCCLPLAQLHSDFVGFKS